MLHPLDNPNVATDLKAASIDFVATAVLEFTGG